MDVIRFVKFPRFRCLLTPRSAATLFGLCLILPTPMAQLRMFTSVEVKLTSLVRKCWVSKFKNALELKKTYSSASLRQHLDETAGMYNDSIGNASLKLLKGKEFGTVKTSVSEYIPYDVDVSPLNNSKSNKEEVSRTYKGDDSFAPIFGYIGTEGYMLNAELRPGRQHCQERTRAFLERGLNSVEELGLIDRLLVRMDSGNDASENLELFLSRGTKFVIKRNLRKEPKERWLALAKALGSPVEPRRGKRVWRGTVSHLTPSRVAEDTPVTVVYEVRTLFNPEIESPQLHCIVVRKISEIWKQKTVR